MNQDRLATGSMNREGQSSLNTNIYATQPTRFTLFMRTFLPWQIWRFMSINVRMMLLIGREKHMHK
jgi:hypothetical protein